MRLLLFLLTFVCTIPLFAQETASLRSIKQPVELSGVVILDSFPAAQLYFNSLLFLNSSFNGVRETSQIRDAKAKSVATKGSFPVSIVNGRGEEIEAKVIFTLVIQSRENIYRYTLNDFYFAYTEETGITSYASFDDRLGLAMSPRQWQQVEAQSEIFFQRFIGGLKERMAQTEVLCKEALAMSMQKKRK